MTVSAAPDSYQDDEDKRCPNFHYYGISARSRSRRRNMGNYNDTNSYTSRGGGSGERGGEILECSHQSNQMNVYFFVLKKSSRLRMITVWHILGIITDLSDLVEGCSCGTATYKYIIVVQHFSIAMST